MEAEPGRQLADPPATWATDPQSRHRSGRYAAYRSSKTALNALTVFYAHTPADDGIKVNALAPGLRRTGLNATAASSGGDPAEAAAGAVTSIACTPMPRPSFGRVGAGGPSALRRGWGKSDEILRQLPST